MTDQQLQAAKLIAHGGSAAKVAASVGVSERTVFVWKSEKAFQAEVARVQREWRDRARTEGIADQDTRLKYLHDRHARLRRVIRERGESPEFATVPGGKTGLLTVTYRMLTRADESGNRISEPVPEYAVDTGLLSELRQLEVNAATELGQWKSKTVTEVDKSEDPLAVALAELLTPEQLEQMVVKLESRLMATEVAVG